MTDGQLADETVAQEPAETAAVQAADGEAPAVTSFQTTLPFATVAATPSTASAQPMVEPMVEPVVEAVLQPVIAEPAVAERETVAEAPVATLAQAAAPIAPIMPIAPVALPKAELEQVLAGAGLQWVETTERPAVAEEPAEVPTPRAPRVRRPRSAPVSEPLQQVETGPASKV